MERHAVTDRDSTSAGRALTPDLDQCRFDEMRHRYANAVQLAICTLANEARRCADVEAKQVLGGAAERLAVLHHLYLMLDEDAGGDALSTRAFLQTFCAHLRNAYLTSADFSCTAECDDVEIEADTRRLLGRAVHELVVNAVKHAFVGRASGRIAISLRRKTASTWRCSVEDDGIGFAGAVPGTGGLGRDLVVALADQMGGHAIWEDREGGSAVHLLIPFVHRPAPGPRPA